MEAERRRYNRITTNSSLRYQFKGSQNFSNAVLKNYGEGGIGFLSNEFFPNLSKLIFEFTLPNSNALVTIVGEVVWTKFQPYSERFLVGARFIEPVSGT